MAHARTMPGAPAAPAGVPELVSRHAAHRPDAPAIRWADGSVSYRELTGWAAAISARLGEVAGRAVAVRVPQGPARFAALLGVLGAGAHLVWLGTGRAGDRVKAVLGELRPARMIVAEDAAADALARWYREELGGGLVTADAPDRAGPFPAVRTGPEDWAYVAYTSGSTGPPKGIPQTHGALAQFVTWFAAEFGLGPGARLAQWVVPEHDPALCETFATLVSGATLHPVPERIRLHPDRLVDWLAAERISHLQTVPSFARELLQAIHRGGAADRLASLGHLLLMGEAVPPELVRGLRAALPHTRLINLYGPTETIAATWHPIGDDEDGAVPIGRPIPGRQVLVVDGRDRPCRTGETGEIVVRSPYVTPGYLGAGADHPAFRPLRGPQDPAPAGYRTYRTGDLARRRPDGALEFRGRKDLQVKVAGVRIELTEVEAVLAAHESVAECAVVAHIGGDGLPDRLIAYVVPAAPGAPDLVPGWRAHLRARFGAETPPVVFVPLAERLPRTPAGKVDRRRLAEARRAGRGPAVPAGTGR